MDVRCQEFDIKVRKGQGAGERCGSRSKARSGARSGASPRQEKEETRGEPSKRRSGRSSVMEECEETSQVVNSAGRIKRRFSDSESE